MVPVEVAIPDWPYDSLDLILFAEAAAAFEELTLSGGLNQLKMQVPDAWPNTFRQSRFLSAVDFVQADRFRRKVANEMARVFSQVDLLLVPSLRDEMLTITNFTGHPSLTLRAGFVEAVRGAQRLGARSRPSTAEVLAAAPRASWRYPDRTALRRGNFGGSRPCAGARLQRGAGRAAARIRRSAHLAPASGKVAYVRASNTLMPSMRHV